MKYLIIALLMFSFFSVSSQQNDYKKDLVELEKLYNRSVENQTQRESNIREHLLLNPECQKKISENHNIYELYNVRNGTPLYLCTDNSASQISTGAIEFKKGGTLNVDITGRNSRIGVWDSNMPLKFHNELDGKIVLRNSQVDVTDHSTHVTTTIVGKGANPSAKGFCHDAKIYVFDWNSDDQEMIREVIDSNLIVSNHSYGIPGGWESGAWRGDRSISDKEDARFGFYDEQAATFDAIANNAPNYTIVKSAGNERGESGGSTIPADGPYDCMTGFSLSKNILTVGAVNKLQGDYSNPDDVVMSSFSSWGPTDDGRIKPDIVAPGVDVFSAVSGSNSSYANFSGTSMAAPCVSGIVSMLQEANQLRNKSYLLSSTIKGILINTAHESGNAPGPDYEFGWGMVDAEEAGKNIIENDGVNRIVIEDELKDGEVFEYTLNPFPNQEIRATLVWNDPAGVPVEFSLDPSDPMLVNDLDMRLISNSQETTFPWVLDHLSPQSPATKADNVIDNVERIDLSNPNESNYVLKISHKGSLTNGKQEFSLVINYTSADPGLSTFYWVGGNGTFSDGAHWSDVSGGAPVNQVPSSSSRVVIDENSFTGSAGKITLDNNHDIHSYFSSFNGNLEIDLADNTIKIEDWIYITETTTNIVNGTLVLENQDEDTVVYPEFGDLDMSNSSMNISAQNLAEWNINNQKINLDKITVTSGELTFVETELSCSTFITDGEAKVLLSDSEIHFSDLFHLNDDTRFINLNSNRLVVKENSAASIILENQILNLDIVVVNAGLTVDRNTIDSRIDNLLLDDSDFILEANFETRNLTLVDAVNVRYQIDTQEPGILTMKTLQVMNGSERVLIESALNSSSIFEIQQREKYCLDNFDVNQVDLEGNAVVAIGGNSSLSNALNWQSGMCSSILFSNFVSNYLCEGAQGRFEDTSDGDIIERVWQVNGEPAWGDEVMDFTFEGQGSYLITLTITAADGIMDSWTEEIEVGSSRIPRNVIIENPTELISQQTADSYQWYRHGGLLDGETNRIYQYNGQPGVYWVLTFEDGCNRKSEVLDLSTSTNNLDFENVSIHPNPVSSRLHIDGLTESNSQWRIKLFDTTGKVIAPSLVKNNQLDVSYLDSGIYLLHIYDEQNILVKKVIKL